MITAGPRRVMVVMVAVVAALAVGAGGTLAIRQIVTTIDGSSDGPGVASLSAITETVVDDRGDVDLPVGDIVTASLTATPRATMSAEVVVDEWTDPSSDDWVFGETGARWQLDVDGDDLADGRVQLSVEGGDVRGGVFGPGGRVVCIGQVATSEVERSYTVSFESSCIGNPEQLRFLPQFAYDDVVFDLESLDVGDWSETIANPGYVDPATSSTTTTTTTTTTPPSSTTTTTTSTTTTTTTTTPTTPPTTTTPATTSGVASIVSLVPGRLLDSRVGGSTVDGESAGIGVRAAGSVTEVRVAGRGGVPVDASAAVLNATLVGAQGPGFATVFPCGESVPNASNLNYVAGQTVANAVVAKLGVGGTVCVFTFAGGDVLLDVNGFVP